MATTDSPLPATCDGCGDITATPTTITDPGSLTTLLDEHAGTCQVCGSILKVRKGVYRSTPDGGLARKFG